MSSLSKYQPPPKFLLLLLLVLTDGLAQQALLQHECPPDTDIHLICLLHDSLIPPLFMRIQTMMNWSWIHLMILVINLTFLSLYFHLPLLPASFDLPLNKNHRLLQYLCLFPPLLLGLSLLHLFLFLLNQPNLPLPLHQSILHLQSKLCSKFVFTLLTKSHVLNDSSLPSLLH